MRKANLAHRVVAAALVLGILAFSAPRASNAAAPHASLKTLRWWQNYGDVWPNSLDPAVGTNTLTIYNIALIHANLVTFDYYKNGSFGMKGDLASHWKISKNRKVWTFFIRPNARFSNGDDVTAQDVKFSLTRALLPATKSPVATTYLGDILGATKLAAGKTKNLQGVKVINKKTVQISLDKPIAYFLGTLSYNTGFVLDHKVMAGKAPSTYMTNTCTGNVGAGPFRLACRSKATNKSSFYPSGHSPYMDFEPNPYYYGKKPHIRIHSPFFSKSDVEYRAFRAGELDGSVVPASNVDQAKKIKGFVNGSAPITDYMTPNQQIAPFNNIHCRLAVAYAIDRVNITKRVLHGTEGPLYSVVPPGILGAFGPSGVPTYDPTRAKKELSQCPGGLKNVTLTYQNTSVDLAHEYDVVQANLAAIGANINLKPLNFNAWLTVVTQNMNQTKNQETITENLWLDDYPDPQDWMDNLLVTGRSYNIGGFSNKTFDKLVAEANVSFNKTKRKQLYTRAQKLALNDGAWISVGYAYAPFVISPKVTGMVDSNGWTWPLHNDWSRVSIK